MKKHFHHILIIPLLLIVADSFYTWSGELNKDERTCNAFLHHRLDSFSQKKILYFSESSNFTFAQSDSSKETISEMLANTINDTVWTIQQGAIHAGVFLKLIKRLKYKPATQTLIIAVNLRSFGINWIESKLETNIARASIFYESYPSLVKKFMVNFKMYDNDEEFQRKEKIKWHYKHDDFVTPSRKYKTVKQWDGDIFARGIKTTKLSIDRDTTELACHFRKNYAFAIDSENPRVKDLEQICTFCRQNNIKLVMHILPENFERAQELIGSDLTYLMRQNVAFINNTFASKATVIDNSEILNKHQFIDLNWPTEHYYESGRRKIAIQISKNL